MIITLLTQFGNLLLLIGALLCGVAIFKAVRAGRSARGAAYYALRQEALNRTRIWAFIATFIFLATGTLALYLTNQPGPTAAVSLNPSTPAPIISPSKPHLPTATFTAEPTVPPSSTPTLAPTQTPAPTATLPPNLPSVLLTPFPSAVPLAPNAKLASTTLASVLDNNGNPIDPGLVFPAGTRSVKVFFRAAGVNNGAAWSVICYRGNQIVDSVVALWRWGPRAQAGRAFCSIDGSAGKYSVVGYLGPNKQFEVGFELLPPTPAPPTPASPTPAPSAPAPPSPTLQS